MYVHSWDSSAHHEHPSIIHVHGMGVAEMPTPSPVGQRCSGLSWGVDVIVGPHLPTELGGFVLLFVRCRCRAGIPFWLHSMDYRRKVGWSLAAGEVGLVPPSACPSYY